MSLPGISPEDIPKEPTRISPIIISQKRGEFSVQCGDRYATQLMRDEVLGVVAHLLLKPESHSWMRTYHEHFEREITNEFARKSAEELLTRYTAEDIEDKLRRIEP